MMNRGEEEGKEERAGKQLVQIDGGGTSLLGTGSPAREPEAMSQGEPSSLGPAKETKFPGFGSKPSSQELKPKPKLSSLGAVA